MQAWIGILITVIVVLLLLILLGVFFWRMLRQEMQHLMAMNQQLLSESSRLTRALSGDIKTQGYWGEMILDRVLEKSGLRAGEDYIIQGAGLGLKDPQGHLLKPDVVICLPEKKHIIIDSKVSLSPYLKYVQSQESMEPHDHARLKTLEQENAVLLKKFLQSLKEHIQSLGERCYESAQGLITPEYVCLFIPVESAYRLAIQEDPNLYDYAHDKGVALVSPSTLIVMLKTVASLWALEKRQKNAEEIARQGAGLYDKMVGVMEDLEKLQQALSKAQEAYSAAFNKISTGRGNLLTRIEHLKELGISSKKDLLKGLS